MSIGKLTFNNIRVKKIIKITIIMFLVSSILQLFLNYTINEQILSRLLYGMDYNTYISSQLQQGMKGLIWAISGNQMPYEWVFTISKWVIVLICVLLLFFTIKKLSKNNSLNKNEFYITIVLFSLLALYNVILHTIFLKSIPQMNYFSVPIVFIVSAGILSFKMLYKSNTIKT